jgi:hypothetical protein
LDTDAGALSRDRDLDRAQAGTGICINGKRGKGQGGCEKKKLEAFMAIECEICEKDARRGTVGYGIRVYIALEQ